MPAAIQRRLGDVKLEHNEHCIYPESKEGTDMGRVQDIDKVSGNFKNYK